MRAEPRDTAWPRLLQCLLGLLDPDDEGEARDAFHDACMRAWEVDAVPFEIVVGAPSRQILPRITFAAPKRPQALARALGLDDHGWGPPHAVGVRPDGRGGVAVRGYHRVTAFPPEIEVPDELRPWLRPLVAAPAPEPELYARWAGPPDWDALHRACERFFGVVLPTPHPRPVDGRGGLGLSLRVHGSRLLLTGYADHTALPPDAEIRRAFGESLPPVERERFERVLAVVRSLGPREGGSWYDVLAWGIDATGGAWRAASLRVPAFGGSPGR